MDNELQRGSIWKRIAAWLLDVMVTSILVVGFILMMAWILDFDTQTQKLEAAYDKYETQYNINFNITQQEYDAFTPEEKTAYEKAYQDAYNALIADQEAMETYNLLVSQILTMVSLGFLLGILTWHFAVPLLLGNGQTVGKKAFGLGLVRRDGVKITPVQLFARTILGKFAVETMIPVCILLMIFFGTTGILGLLVLLILAVAQFICFFFTYNHTAIHDMMAVTVVVDISSQTVFKSAEDLLAYQKKVAADRAARQPY